MAFSDLDGADTTEPIKVVQQFIDTILVNITPGTEFEAGEPWLSVIPPPPLSVAKLLQENPTASGTVRLDLLINVDAVVMFTSDGGTFYGDFEKRDEIFGQALYSKTFGIEEFAEINFMADKDVQVQKCVLSIVGVTPEETPTGP